MSDIDLVSCNGIWTFRRKSDGLFVAISGHLGIEQALLEAEQAFEDSDERYRQSPWLSRAGVGSTSPWGEITMVDYDRKVIRVNGGRLIDLGDETNRLALEQHQKLPAQGSA